MTDPQTASDRAPDERIICALDVPTTAEAAALAGSSGRSGASCRAAFCRARLTRPSSHSAAKAAGSPPATCPRLHRCSRPTACLQGNLRLGQEHVKAGPDRSTHTR